MTDDVTRGLGLLADEAEAAAIDTDAVIARATARTRNRAILTATLATVILVCALVMTLGAVKPDRAPVATTPPIMSTGVQESWSPEEQAVRATRLQSDITSAFDRILPSGWQHSTFDWGCEFAHCWANGDVIDDVGTISMGFVASGRESTVSCDGKPNCTSKTLDDGTFVAFSKGERRGLQNEPQMWYSIYALRPDGRAIGFSAWWPTNRPAPKLTDEQWLEFAKAFTY